MINLEALKTKTKTSEYVGARVTPELKEWFEKFCRKNQVSNTAVITALLESFRAEQLSKGFK